MPTNTGVFIAERPAEVVRSASVTTRQLFVASFDALMRARGATAVKLSKATGISDATLSKFTTNQEHIQRWPTDQHFDALAGFFRVEPYVLLRPEAALAGRLLDSRHTAVAQSPGDHISLPPQTSETGGLAVEHDPELWAALGRYWDALTTEQRLELVGHGYRLRKSAPHAADFKQG